MKLNHKLILVIASLALGFSSVAYFAVYRSRQALEESIGASCVVLAQETSDRIDRSIYTRIEEMQAYAKVLALAEELASSNRAFEEIADVQGYVNERDKEWTSVGRDTITPFMQELISNELSAELREKVDFYAQKHNYRVFAEVFVTNKYGTNVAQTGKTTDYYQADEEWWQHAKEHALHIADILYDSSADAYSTDIAVRINDKDGGFLGVIKGVLNVKEVIRIVKEVQWAKKHKSHAEGPYTTLHLSLLTKQGRIIYSTKEFEFLHDVPGVLSSCVEKKGEDPGYFIATVHEPGQKEQFCAHAHSKGYGTFEGLGWIVVVEYETGEIFAPVAELRNDIAIVSAVVALLVLVLMFIVLKGHTPESQ